jgi:hypothetical protein
MYIKLKIIQLLKFKFKFGLMKKLINIEKEREGERESKRGRNSSRAA